MEPSAFEDSFLVGVLGAQRPLVCVSGTSDTGKLVLGDALAGTAALNLNPLLLSGWAALLVNALNSIPVGTLHLQML